jgi:hypothetical protein
MKKSILFFVIASASLILAYIFAEDKAEVKTGAWASMKGLAWYNT